MNKVKGRDKDRWNNKKWRREKGNAKPFGVWKLLVKISHRYEIGESISPLHNSKDYSSMGNFIQRLERICCVLLFFLLVYLFYFHFVVISCHCPYLEDVHFGTFSLLISDDYTLHGPIFIQEPSHVMFPLDSEEKKVKLTCEVKGNPKPHIRFVNLKACVLTRILSVIKQQILMEC